MTGPRQVLPAFGAYSGSRQPSILFIGEAWGRDEADLKVPFIGASGKEFFLMLGEAFPEVEPELHAEIVALHPYGLAWAKKREDWLQAAGFGLTNVVNEQPPGNRIEEFCAPKAEVGKFYDLPALTKGKYLRPEFLPELDRLEAEITALAPNLVVALGNTALWALTRTTNIGQVRGTTREGFRGAWRGKILPTYHPAGVMRQWHFRPIVVADLQKAERERKFPEIRRPDRWIKVSPSIEEVETWTALCLANPPAYLSTDVETECRQITDVGFADTRGSAIVIPFWNKKTPGWSYWPDLATELRAWNCVAALLEAMIEKVLQNGIYDLQYFLSMGIRPSRMTQDTMLKHHSLFPEVLKGLGFLGSIYTDEPAWKLMARKRPESEKRDE